jgi:DNA-binding NtrC family response regulator
VSRNVDIMTTAIVSRQKPTPAAIAQIQLEDKQTAAATEARATATQVVLLLTCDRTLEKSLSEALHNSVILMARDIDDALQIMAAHSDELSLVVIDFDDGCHGMTLLSAIKDCLEKLPVIVATSSDTYHAAAVAYANGAAACLAKPITTAELKVVIRQLRQAKLELTATSSGGSICK